MKYNSKRYETKLKHKKLGELIMKKHSANYNIVKVTKAIVAIAIAAAAVLPINANAQDLIQPPTIPINDENGVNLASGMPNLPDLQVSIGTETSGIKRTVSVGSDETKSFLSLNINSYQSPSNPYGIYVMTAGFKGVAYRFVFGRPYLGASPQNQQGVISVAPNEIVKEMNGTATMSCNSTPFTPSNTAQGIYYNTGSCLLTLSDGTKVTYDNTKAVNSLIGGQVANAVMPDGEVLSYTYSGITLLSVNSSLGWMIKYSGGFVGVGNGNAVQTLNTAMTYCDPSSATCNYEPNAPSANSTVVGNTTNYYNNGQLTATKVLPQSPSVYPEVVSSPSGISVMYNHNINTGKVSSVVKGGYTWTYNYLTDAEYNTVTTVTAPNSSTKKLGATRHGLISFTEDELGRRTKYTYGGTDSDKLVKITFPDGDANGGYQTFIRDSDNNITSTTIVPKGGGTGLTSSSTFETCNATNYKYCRKPLTTTDAAGVTTVYTYDPAHGGVLSVTTPAVNGVQAQTRYGYSQITPLIKGPSGNMVAQPPVWRLTSTSSCMTQNLAACVGTTDERKTVITYSQTNVLPITTTTMLGDGTLPQTSTFTYDYSGRVIASDGPENYGGNPNVDKTYTFYDNLGRSIGSIGSDPDGAGPRPRPVSKTVYDIDGRVSEQISGYTSGIDLAAFNAMSPVEKVAYEYDTITGLAKVTRAYANEPTGWVLKNVSQTSYDNMMRVDCVAQRLNPAAFASLPASACTLGTPGSDGPDQITKNVYDNGNAVTSAYSAYGTPSQITAFTKTFNPLSRTLATISDAKGNKTTYTYDNYNRPIKTCYPSAANGTISSTTDCEEISYYGARLYTTRTRDGQYKTFYYDPKGRVSVIASTKTQWFYYNNFDELYYHYNQHDANRNYYTVTNRNALGWVTSVGNVTDAATPVRWTTYYYDAYGRRAHMYYPDGYLLSYQYNDGGELTGLLENNTTPIYGFAYDILGRSQQTGRLNGVNTTYGFDSQSRLTGLTHTTMNTTSFTHGTTNQIKTRANSNAAYDFNGNPANDNATHNGLNQIATRQGTGFTYDARGNLTNDGTSSYTYNIDNQLLTATLGGVTTTFDYDAENRLYSTTKNGITNKYVYDGLDLIMEYDGAGNVLRRYVHGGGIDEPLLWYEGAGLTDKRYLHADNQGSIVGTTNPAGAVLSTSAYDPYGNRQSSNAAYASRFGYTGQIELPDVGLKYYKARFYSPTLGRFLQSDPIGYQAGMNMYGYVLGDPVNFNDPLGLEEQKVDTVVVTATRPPKPPPPPDLSHPSRGSSSTAPPQVPETVVVTAPRRGCSRSRERLELRYEDAGDIRPKAWGQARWNSWDSINYDLYHARENYQGSQVIDNLGVASGFGAAIGGGAWGATKIKAGASGRPDGVGRFARDITGNPLGAKGSPYGKLGRGGALSIGLGVAFYANNQSTNYLYHSVKILEAQRDVLRYCNDGR